MNKCVENKLYSYLTKILEDGGAIIKKKIIFVTERVSSQAATSPENTPACLVRCLVVFYISPRRIKTPLKPRDKFVSSSGGRYD
jgi:hypothetical protein